MLDFDIIIPLPIPKLHPSHTKSSRQTVTYISSTPLHDINQQAEMPVQTTPLLKRSSSFTELLNSLCCLNNPSLAGDHLSVPQRRSSIFAPLALRNDTCFWCRPRRSSPGPRESRFEELGFFGGDDDEDDAPAAAAVVDSSPTSEEEEEEEEGQEDMDDDDDDDEEEEMEMEKDDAASLFQPLAATTATSTSSSSSEQGQDGAAAAAATTTPSSPPTTTTSSPPTSNNNQTDTSTPLTSNHASPTTNNNSAGKPVDYKAKFRNFLRQEARAQAWHAEKLAREWAGRPYWMRCPLWMLKAQIRWCWEVDGWRAGVLQGWLEERICLRRGRGRRRR